MPALSEVLEAGEAVETGVRSHPRVANVHGERQLSFCDDVGDGCLAFRMRADAQKMLFDRIHDGRKFVPREQHVQLSVHGGSADGTTGVQAMVDGAFRDRMDSLGQQFVGAGREHGG